MRYGISSSNSGCDYTVFHNSIFECKKWILLYLHQLEEANTPFIQIVDADNPVKILFYENVKWENGQSNLKEIADKIARL